MPKYVPFLVALFLAVAPAAAWLPASPSEPHVGPHLEPHGARTVPLQPVPHVAPRLEPNG